MKPYIKIFLIFIGLPAMIMSCSHRAEFEVKDFRPLTNWNRDTLFLDYNGAVENGFILPSVSQAPGGKFSFSFLIKNKSGKPCRFRYKIYYQNESYKFPENKSGVFGRQNSLAQENFYGSWEDVSKTFASTSEITADSNFHMVMDSFRIVGNPRNEQRYYGPSSHIVIPGDSVAELVKYIKTDKKWYSQIEEKAHAAHRSVDTQMQMDAEFVLRENREKILGNNRWQRNPRVGKYNFLLVVIPDHKKEIIPPYIADISLKDGDEYINPFYYFLYGKGKEQENMQVLLAKNALSVAAKPDLARGIYINKSYFKDIAIDTSSFRENCNDGERMYSLAPFEQYTNYIDPRFPLHNIPVVADVQGGAYTASDYAKNASMRPVVTTPVKNSDCPCRTVISKPDHSLVMVTPATRPGEWRKENVGLISRNGFTYGRFRAKVKMPELLNSTQLWNGLTNAFWLLSQNNKPWNYRRHSEGGYIPKEENNVPPVRKKDIGYSEIDFEMIKAAHFWPATSYKGRKEIPHETAADADNVMIAYTNWDMANHDVSRFTMGADSVGYMGRYYGIHRWDQNYKALTGKYPAKDDELFKGDYFYFEIEWAPTEIIWRIGPEKDKMRIIGYVNESVSSIPDNQMVLVFTQEYHDAKWWPGSPFVQDRIPFPAKAIMGNIYEVEVY